LEYNIKVRPTVNIQFGKRLLVVAHILGTRIEKQNKCTTHLLL
jgi:hypothetical protein